MSDYECKKYLTTKEELKTCLEKYGVAIIPNVLDEKECDKMLSQMWDFFEHITQKWEIPLKRDDKKTYREFYKLSPLHSMLVQYFNVGQAQVSWDLRQNEKIVDIFSHFWKTKKEDLLVSFDGLSFNLPPETTNKGWNRSTWFHTDQSYSRNDFECMQSWVTALDVNEGDATLAFYEGSHNFHKNFADEYEIDNTADWYKLKNGEEQFYIDNGCSMKKIKCEKGSMVFWDSRTVHCGVEALKGRDVPNFRSVVYLCYAPRELCSESDLKKKKDAFKDLRTTNHYPSKPKLFPKKPRTYYESIPETTIIDPPVLSELGLKLAGF